MCVCGEWGTKEREAVVLLREWKENTNLKPHCEAPPSTHRAHKGSPQWAEAKQYTALPGTTPLYTYTGACTHTPGQLKLGQIVALCVPFGHKGSLNRAVCL